MVDMSAIVAAGNSFKIAVDIAKGIQSLKTSTEVREKTSALLDAVVDGRYKLLDASEAQAALLARIKELEEKILSFENWDSEKERYELTAIDRGAFAYMHKPGMENGEPLIWLCQTCFDKRHKSPLQFRAQDVGQSRRFMYPNEGRGLLANFDVTTCWVYNKKALQFAVNELRDAEEYLALFRICMVPETKNQRSTSALGLQSLIAKPAVAKALQALAEQKQKNQAKPRQRQRRGQRG